MPQNPLLFPSPSPRRGWTRAEFLMDWGRWVRGGGEIPPPSLRTVLFLSTSWRVESPASPSSSSLLGFSLQLLPLPLKPWFQLSESMPSQQGRRLPREVRLPPAIFSFVPGIRNFPRGAKAETEGTSPATLPRASLSCVLSLAYLRGLMFCDFLHFFCSVMCPGCEAA